MPPEPTVLVVDDEPHARESVLAALATRPDVRVVGSAADGLAGLAAIEELQPDLLFLDVQMPGLDGFAVLEHLAPERRPTVVFATAYEQYALRAFAAHAIDYLLKPFDRGRILGALDRALTWRAAASQPAQLAGVLADLGRQRPRDRFAVKHAGRMRLVPASELHWIEAAGNYVHLHTAADSFLMRETVTNLAGQLSLGQFLRVHRSAIVALGEVLASERLPSGDYELHLRSGARVPMSRSHRADFLARWTAPRS
ncbi:MAG: response regulator transcription factor [Planctomycetes bacterium]|nr:response regulator transcription factor [Planctomycetota bacterium]